MGGKPTAAAGAAATTPVSTGTSTTTTAGRFGMPQAVVIVAFVVTAAFLAPSGMNVRDVLLLLAGAGTTGATVVAMAVTGSSRAGRISRMVRAYFSAGN
ncbi:hypothetical protein [Streptomyces sp. NBC_00986]|uniref:hypothetical protein n=1 Tax=Streptomyces sp. NBC_00986 TaxID=2903702 RepID=UPI003863B4C6|nr:hypothetical protein OG504_00010 [Streptomyces sp. NBC_00986]WSX64560.1 hypothetical protein OG504_52740 [Streptomyces sp. NBC_00986]